MFEGSLDMKSHLSLNFRHIDGRRQEHCDQRTRWDQVIDIVTVDIFATVVSIHF